MTARSPEPPEPRGFTALARAIALLAACGAAILVLGILLMALVTFVPALDRPGMHLRGIANFFYADHEANAWAWFSTLLLAALGAALTVLAYLRRCANRGFAPLLVLALLAAYMSADEAAAIHERFSNLVPRIFTWSWLAIGVPLAIAARGC